MPQHNEGTVARGTTVGYPSEEDEGVPPTATVTAANVHPVHRLAATAVERDTTVVVPGVLDFVMVQPSDDDDLEQAQQPRMIQQEAAVVAESVAVPSLTSLSNPTSDRISKNNRGGADAAVGALEAWKTPNEVTGEVGMKIDHHLAEPISNLPILPPADEGYSDCLGNFFALGCCFLFLALFAALFIYATIKR